MPRRTNSLVVGDLRSFDSHIFVIDMLVYSFHALEHFSAPTSIKEFINLQSATSTGGLSDVNTEMTDVKQTRIVFWFLPRTFQWWFLELNRK